MLRRIAPLRRAPPRTAIPFGHNRRISRSAALSPQGEARAAEILHVDTASSRVLYRNFNPQEKAIAQRLLKRAFQIACAQNRGVVKHWAGDGGFALFRSSRNFGNSVLAAESFLENISTANAETARALDVRIFERSVRIKAHRGEVFQTREPGIDSGNPPDFDDFLKFEKSFAPKTDEFFITQALYGVLPARLKKGFECYSNHVKAGSITTRLHRLKRRPVDRAEDIFRHGDQVASINEKDWSYLRTQIFAHRVNVAARNLITKGLISAVARAKPHSGGICPETLLRLTVDAIYNYVRTVFPNQRVRVSYWHGSRDRRHLQKIYWHYPKDEMAGNPKRKISLHNKAIKACQAFHSLEPVATPSVVAARNDGTWFDLDPRQASRKRDLASALQIPVFCVSDHEDRDAKGVLSLDSDKPDMFLIEEIDLWRDDLVGFLANVALAEKLMEHA